MSFPMISVIVKGWETGTEKLLFVLKKKICLPVAGYYLV